MTRIAKGTFAKGVSGNPDGRPTQATNLRDLARAHTEEAIEVLVTIMQDKHASVVARVNAAGAILDRAHGKPTQMLGHDIPVLEDGSPINVLVAVRQIAFCFHRGKQALDRAESERSRGGSDPASR